VHCRRRPGVEKKEHIMNRTASPRKSVTAAFGALVAGAAASALLSLGAGISHAGEFDPQPDPPGQSRGFGPQPEPPTRHVETFNPPPGINASPGLKQVNAGQ
jgi:hypothetical protein